MRKRVALVAVMAILVCLIVYAAFIEPHLLTVERKKLDFDLEKPLRVVQFTDTQLGDYFTLEQLANTVALINRQSPDIVIFTGDFLDEPREYEYQEEAVEVLKLLDNGILKIAINGNHDLGGGGEKIYDKLMMEAGFEVLVNSEVLYRTDSGKTLAFFGIDDAMLGHPNFSQLRDNIKAEDINILLTHEPDLYEAVKDLPIDLVLAGHSHGGQICLPILGPVITPPNAHLYKKGFYNIENSRKTLLYVNSGLGNTKMRFRFGNPPKITVFELE